MNPTLWRRLLAEFAGTALLVTAVVGSGIMASRLSDDIGLQLLENSVATAFALGALILTFGPVSGAHFNPVVSAADWFLGRRTGTGLSGRDLGGYIAAQTAGAIGGAILADLMFKLPAVDFSAKHRAGTDLWLGEVVATTGLLLLIFALARSGRASVAPAAVGAYIGARLLVHQQHQLREPSRDDRPRVHRHLRRDRPRVGAGFHHRAARRPRRRRRVPPRPVSVRRQRRR